MYTRKKISIHAFSLVEVLVAVSILLLFIVGPMGIAVQSSRGIEYSNEQATAFFLAQEGLELAQNARDHLVIEGRLGITADPWGDFTDTTGDFGTCYTNGQGCALKLVDTGSGDIDSVSAAPCTGASCRLYVYMIDDGGEPADPSPNNTPRMRFIYESDKDSNDTETMYTREIYFESVGADSVKVTSEVTWRSSNRLADSSVEVVTYLFNIYD